jgi:hypothetical protein
MTLPFLKKVYLPTGTTTPQFEKLYDTILGYQAKPDSSAQIFLPERSYDHGVLITSGIRDPFDGSTHEVLLTDLEDCETISFEASSPVKIITSAGKGDGVIATTTLPDGNCGISSASGVFKLRRAWDSVNEEGEIRELFEGYMTLKVGYSHLFLRKGFGKGDTYALGFWAVRARRNKSGDEIGVTPTEGVSPMLAGSAVTRKDDHEDSEDDDDDPFGRYGLYGY